MTDQKEEHLELVRSRDACLEELCNVRAALGASGGENTVDRVKGLIESLAMVKGEVDMLRGVGCLEDGDGPCGACLKCARRERDEISAQLAALREAIGVVRGCYAALPGVDPGILAYVDETIAATAPAVEAYNEYLANAERRLSEVTRERDEAREAIHAAHEQGARWALEAEETGTDAWIDSNAARICAEARAKGGE